MKHLFITNDGAHHWHDEFMQGPPLGPNMVWVSHRNVEDEHTTWLECPSPHDSEGDPSHPSYDLHIFGEHHTTFMKRQYK